MLHSTSIIIISSGMVNLTLDPSRHITSPPTCNLLHLQNRWLCSVYVTGCTLGVFWFQKCAIFLYFSVIDRLFTFFVYIFCLHLLSLFTLFVYFYSAVCLHFLFTFTQLFDGLSPMLQVNFFSINAKNCPLCWEVGGQHPAVYSTLCLQTAPSISTIMSF